MYINSGALQTNKTIGKILKFIFDLFQYRECDIKTLYHISEFLELAVLRKENSVCMVPFWFNRARYDFLLHAGLSTVGGARDLCTLF